MTSSAKTQNLLYVSNSDGTVEIYSYPLGTSMGRLADVRANGLCSAENGDVFVLEGNEVLKYVHGGARPVAVLHDSLGGAVQFCAVDPSTGNLAVSGGDYPRLGVAVYQHSTGQPKLYTAAVQSSGYWSCAYDRNGDLFVERFSQSTAFNEAPRIGFAELARGGAAFESVTVSGAAPSRLGALAWDGRFLAAVNPASRESALLARYAVGARRLTFSGATVLADAGIPLHLWIADGRVVLPRRAVGSQGPGVMLYRYPQGGAGAQIVRSDGAPQDATVSEAAQSEVAVTTYHYDNLRTGWNDSESALTYASVKSGSFGLLHAVRVDDQVDAQPLIAPGETTTRGVAPGKHDVVYVATENDTVYAIDASSGTVLFSQNLGHPVPTPLGCTNNGPNVGINGTPVLDLNANVMYVIAYSLEGGVPVYRIHELNLSNLEDAVPPVIVAASHTLTDGTTFTFNATYQRQRPALLEANGNVYAGFGSFCDFATNLSRGWLLGWQTGPLVPLPANRLNDSLATSPDDFFLSSIWMSGYGVAADPSGDLYFVTGNSDPSTYNGVTNVQESVVKVSADLTQLLSIFTPSDVNVLDVYDEDFGSGGALLLPATVPSQPPLLAAAGKEGTMFLLDRNSLGGYNPSGNNDLGEESIGDCWCGLSYFDAAKDGTPRIVASGGTYVTIWRVGGSSSVKLSGDGISAYMPTGQDPGFFTSVSSNGSRDGAIVWAVARPQSAPGVLTLVAMKSEPSKGGSRLQTLFQGSAGWWTSGGGNANVVPVVANGKVYVASYQQLDIFGLGAGKSKVAVIRSAGPRRAGPAPHEVSGTLVVIAGSSLTLRTRTGTSIRVDDSEAVRRRRTADLVRGESFTASGAYDAAGVLHATLITRAKPSASMWPADR